MISGILGICIPGRKGTYLHGGDNSSACHTIQWLFETSECVCTVVLHFPVLVSCNALLMITATRGAQTIYFLALWP